MLPFISRSSLSAAAWVSFALSAAVGVELGCSPTRRTLVAVSGSSSSVGSSSSGLGGSIGTGGMAGTGGSNDAGPDASPCSDSCGDPACLAQGYTCASNPPPDAGWIGPGYLYDAPGMAPDCGAAWAQPTKLGGGSLMSTPLVCSPCTCDAATNQACSQVTLAFGHDPSCLAGTTSTAPLNGCQAALVPTGSPTYVKATIAAVGGSCAPVGGVAINPSAPSFGTELAACDTPITMPLGCSAGSTCLPTAPASFTGGICIHQSGDLVCPAGYPNKTLSYQGFADTRMCQPCTCTAPTGGTCPGRISYYYDSLQGCSGASINVPTGECLTVPAPEQLDRAWFTGIQEGVAVDGGCANDGGAPTGAVTGAVPTTICCQ